MKQSFFCVRSYPTISKRLEVDLSVVHDDWFPLYYGGNKARKMVRIMEDISHLRCTAVVTNGGTQSNHARVVALMAADKGWKCNLILHGDPADLTNPRGNLLLMQLAGADITVVQPDHIGEEIESSLTELRTEGLNPFQIPGGGHCPQGAAAIVEAIDELYDQIHNYSLEPEYIVLASGTGSTQAGIIVGLDKVGWNTKVIGISVARHNPRGTKVVEEACRDLRAYLQLPAKNDHVDFRDEWVGDGYEKENENVCGVIRKIAGCEGLILDPTYTGKAFSGMLDLIDTGEIPVGSRVLFWHTGGLLNLMTSDYFKGLS